MRVKLDENLPVALANVLTAIGHDVDTVEQEHLTGGSDEAVWRATKAAKRFLVTQDLDFSDTRLYAPGMGIPLIPTTDSGTNRPPVPEDSVHAFRIKSSTCSAGLRPAVPQKSTTLAGRPTRMVWFYS